VAILSCLVCSEKNDEEIRVKDEMTSPYRVLQDAARRVAQVIHDATLPIDMTEYVNKFQPNFVDLVLAWCRGAKFAEICKMTDVYEGTIIRSLRRLEELLNEMSAAAKAIGNSELEAKFKKGQEKLKRDIVFAASLYL